MRYKDTLGGLALRTRPQVRGGFKSEDEISSFIYGQEFSKIREPYKLFDVPHYFEHLFAGTIRHSGSSSASPHLDLESSHFWGLLFP